METTDVQLEWLTGIQPPFKYWSSNQMAVRISNLNFEHVLNNGTFINWAHVHDLKAL